MTQSTRERFEKWKEEEYSYWNDSASDLYSFWSFIEQEIANAKREWAEEIKKQWDYAIRAWMNQKEMKVFYSQL